MNHHPDDDRVAELARWLIAEARLSLAPLELIDRFCHQLIELGVPLWRLRAGQRLANPLASASPSHIAAAKGMTSRQPRTMTRATNAATLGPGEPAATVRAPAKISRPEASTDFPSATMVSA